MENLTDFIDEIRKLPPPEVYENWYRGHPDKDYELVPTVYREGLIQSEDTIFKEAITRVPRDFVQCRSTVEKLVKMQHYDVPTRLLDITANPLVALYFACNKKNKSDGEVIYLQIPKHSIKYYDSDTVSVLSNIAKRPNNFKINPNITEKAEFNGDGEIELLLHDIKEEKSYFQNSIDPVHMGQVFAVKVKLDNERILRQEGAFLIFGIDIEKSKQAKVPSPWVEDDRVKLVIPKSSKKQILQELETLGISRRTMFPELESQGKYLRKRYREKK